MKKLIGVLSVISAYITCFIIICTFLTSYQFLFVVIVFKSYRTIQISLSITLIILALKFIICEYGKKRIVMSIICLLLSVVLIYSTFLVY